MAGEKVVYHLFVADFFGPTDRELFWVFFVFFFVFSTVSGPEIVSLALEWSPSLDTLTRSFCVSHRRRNLPQQPALARTSTNNSKTDAQTFAPALLKYVCGAHTSTRVHHCATQERSITFLFQAAA